MEFLLGLLVGVMLTFAVLLIMGGLGIDPDEWS